MVGFNIDQLSLFQLTVIECDIGTEEGAAMQQLSQEYKVTKGLAQVLSFHLYLCNTTELRNEYTKHHTSSILQQTYQLH